MSEDSQNKKVIRERYGLPVYKTNPSVPISADGIVRKRKTKVGNDKKGFVIDNLGEIVGTGIVAFYEFEEVDETRFVKLYLKGQQATKDLSKSGLAVFELVYLHMINKPNMDEVKLNADDCGMASSTFRRGVRELLEKELLFLSPYPGVFFININHVFNGDRLAFIKGYSRKKGAAVLSNDKITE